MNEWDKHTLSALTEITEQKLCANLFSLGTSESEADERYLLVMTIVIILHMVLLLLVFSLVFLFVILVFVVVVMVHNVNTVVMFIVITVVIYNICSLFWKTVIYTISNIFLSKYISLVDNIMMMKQNKYKSVSKKFFDGVRVSLIFDNISKEKTRLSNPQRIINHPFTCPQSIY